jgi:hypothetical protein
MATYLQSLLGEDEFQKTQQGARNMGLLQAGLAGLMASGPSLTPTSAGQALGAAGLSGLTGYQDAISEAERQGLQGIEFEQMQQSRQSDEAFKAALPEVFKDGRINYPALQQLALVYPKEVGDIVTAYKAAQPPQAPSVNLQFDAKTGSIFNPKTGEVTYTGNAQQDGVNLQFDPKTGTVFNPRTGEVTRVDGGQAQVGVVIPDNATPAQAAEIYRKAAQNERDSAEAKRLFDLANAVDPESKVKPPTDSQLRAGGFYDRMSQSVEIIDPLEAAGEYPMVGAAMAQSIPFVGDMAKRVVMSPEEQRYQQAADDWIRAKLRQESGAVISDDEMRSEYNTYFPQPGDSKEVIAQKRRARQTATNSMAKAAGPAVDLVKPTQSTSGDLAAQARAERERRQRGQ